MLVLESEVALNAGENVALVLGTTRGTCAVTLTGDPYPGGRSFSQNPATGTQWSESTSAYSFKALAR